MNGDRLIQAEGIAAALMSANINTDIVAPPTRGGAARDRYGAADDGATRVFGPWRYADDGSEHPDFILNQAPFRNATFLVAGENFGCGSSRETAPQWLRAFGLRCIVAPSFGGIFYDNCFRNGILPLRAERALCERLADQAMSGRPFCLDMGASRLTSPDGDVIAFELPSFRRALLMDGVDVIATIEAQSDAIARYQAEAHIRRPWIWPSPDMAPQ